MEEKLAIVVAQQIKYLENHRSPEGLESLHMHFLEILREAESGSLQPLIEVKANVKKLRDIFDGSEIKYRESTRNEKLNLAGDGVYRRAIQDTTLQKSLDAAMDATIDPTLKTVIYMLKILGPVTALMDDFGDDEQ